MELHDDPRITETEDGRFLFERPREDGMRYLGVLQKSGFGDGSWTSTWFVQTADGNRVFVDGGLHCTCQAAYNSRPDGTGWAQAVAKLYPNAPHAYIDRPTVAE